MLEGRTKGVFCGTSFPGTAVLRNEPIYAEAGGFEKTKPRAGSGSPLFKVLGDLKIRTQDRANCRRVENATALAPPKKTRPAFPESLQY
jgi:hypothetical protein